MGKSVTPSDLARARTWNLLIRSQAPYPLGHKANFDNMAKISYPYHHTLSLFQPYL